MILWAPEIAISSGRRSFHKSHYRIRTSEDFFASQMVPRTERAQWGKRWGMQCEDEQMIVQPQAAKVVPLRWSRLDYGTDATYFNWSRYFPLRKFLSFRKRKASMDRGRGQVIKGNSETHSAKIVILLRAPAKPILESCSAAKLHLTHIRLASFVNCPALMHSELSYLGLSVKNQRKSS